MTTFGFQIPNFTFGGADGWREAYYTGAQSLLERKVAVALVDAPGQLGNLNADWYNRPEVMRASIPAMGGIANARSVAKHYAMLERGGELDGVRLLSPERIRVAAEVQNDEMDFLFNVRARRSMGNTYARSCSTEKRRNSGSGSPYANTCTQTSRSRAAPSSPLLHRDGRLVAVHALSPSGPAGGGELEGKGSSPLHPTPETPMAL